MEQKRRVRLEQVATVTPAPAEAAVLAVAASVAGRGQPLSGSTKQLWQPSSFLNHWLSTVCDGCASARPVAGNRLYGASNPPAHLPEGFFVRSVVGFVQ